MIRRLTLTDVGPTRELKFDFAPRMNVLTGDNGLGKSFVLDLLWWVLTTSWAGEKAFPWRPPESLDSGPRSVIEEEGSGYAVGSPDGSGYGGGNAKGAGSSDGSGYGGGNAKGAGSSDGSGYGGGSGSGAGSSDGSGYGDGGLEINPEITAVISHHDGDRRQDDEVITGGTYQWESQEWARKPWKLKRDASESELSDRKEDEAAFRPPSLVIYARIDGSYAIWDSYYVKGGIDNFSEAAIVVQGSELWDGKKVLDTESPGGGERTVIAGLIADWVNWQQRAKSPEFEALRHVLHALGSPDEPLVPAEPTRVHLRDRRDIPALASEYGVTPVTLASAGVRRVLSLAYLLVWAWTEHSRAAKQSRRAPTRDIVLLIDEPELHLHPGWQRVFLPSVLKGIEMIAPRAVVQVFAATHSPMVLASLENMVREEQDGLFVLERDGWKIRVNPLPLGKEGDVSDWLASDVFGRVGGRAREAELAIEAAMDFMAGRTDDAEHHLLDLRKRLAELPDATVTANYTDTGRPLLDRVHQALKDTLADNDEFWVQWVVTYHNAPDRPVKR